MEALNSTKESYIEDYIKAYKKEYDSSLTLDDELLIIYALLQEKVSDAITLSTGEDIKVFKNYDSMYTVKIIPPEMSKMDNVTLIKFDSDRGKKKNSMFCLNIDVIIFLIFIIIFIIISFKMFYQ